MCCISARRRCTWFCAQRVRITAVVRQPWGPKNQYTQTAPVVINQTDEGRKFCPFSVRSKETFLGVHMHYLRVRMLDSICSVITPCRTGMIDSQSLNGILVASFGRVATPCVSFTSFCVLISFLLVFLVSFLFLT